MGDKWILSLLKSHKVGPSITGVCFRRLTQSVLQNIRTLFKTRFARGLWPQILPAVDLFASGTPVKNLIMIFLTCFPAPMQEQMLAI